MSLDLLGAEETSLEPSPAPGGADGDNMVEAFKSYSPLILKPGVSSLPARNPPPRPPAPMATPAKQAAAPVPTMPAPSPQSTYRAKTTTAMLADAAPYVAGGAVAIVLGVMLFGRK